MSKFQLGVFEKSLFKKVLFYYKKCSKIPKSGNILEKYFNIFFLAFLESRHHNLRKYAKKNLQFCPSLTFTEDIVKSTFYSKTAVFWTFLKKPSLELAHICSRYVTCLFTGKYAKNIYMLYCDVTKIDRLMKASINTEE